MPRTKRTARTTKLPRSEDAVNKTISNNVKPANNGQDDETNRSTMILPVSIFASVIGALIAFLALKGTEIPPPIKFSSIKNDIHDDVLFQHNASYGDGDANTIPTKHEDDNICKYYLAKSSIPHSGLGVYTTEAIKAGSRVGQDIGGDGEIVIPLPDINPMYAAALHTLLFDYVWGGDEVGAQYEGKNVLALIPGLGMLANGHYKYDNIQQSYGPSIDHGGLVRGAHPGAGAISHYHNYSFVASEDIEAGGELIVNYGKNWFKEREQKGKILSQNSELAEMKRDLSWLNENGLCIDNIKPGKSTNSQAGRGAFAVRFLPKGSVVAPAPIVQILDRRSLQLAKIKTDSYGHEQVETVDQLLLNYCFGSKHSSLLFFPYAPSVNYINHNSTANVELRWSQSSQHDHQNVQNMTIEDIRSMEHGGLMLEFVATRDIENDEEIFLDYGHDWEEAWNEHVGKWKTDMNIPSIAYSSKLDKNPIIRTEREQLQSPYPPNIFTSCYYSYHTGKSQNKKQGKMYLWESTDDIFYDRNMRPCSVLNRHHGDDGNEYYSVAIRNRFGLKEKERIPQGEMHLVTNVPRNAIRFSNKIFTTDMHLSNVFRHSIHLGDDIFPSHWNDLKDNK